MAGRLQVVAEFDRWAVYYDLLHQGLEGDIEFYAEQTRRSGGEALEIGCGTGRIAIPLAMSGMHVTGLELSEAMLAVCREKYAAVAPVRGSLDLVRGDMRDFQLDRKFPVVIMPYRTFMHLLTVEDQVRCLDCIREHLEDGGRFVCNLWAARPSAIARFLNNNVLEKYQLADMIPVPGEAVTLLHFYAVHYDENRQIMEERHRIQEKDAEGRLAEQTDLRLTRSWLTPREMEHLLARCGFETEAVYGDFSGAPFNAESREMIWCCKKTPDMVCPAD
jgi:SAM-dependent methyltransferase